MTYPTPSTPEPAHELGRLPTYLTSFIGRRAELTEVCELLARHRAVTLIGAGGCGKTRLAVEAVARSADRAAPTTVWIDLGSVNDPGRVAELVAAAAGVLVVPSSGELLGLPWLLRDRELTLCLDNCEHLLGACGALIEALVGSCPGVRVLATSREPLGLSGEVVWRVPSMTETEAVDLFVDRARLARPDFSLDAAREPAIRTVCRRLDGIPLALELAAAWVRTLSPDQIAAALDDRFRLLVGGPHTPVPRQRTLAASVDWSHALLDPAAQRVLHHLAVFSGGFTLDAAKAVCTSLKGDTPVLTPIRRLVDASLVTIDDEGTSRYDLPETIREYAYAKLADSGEVEAARDRHLEYFLRIAETWSGRFDTDDHDVVLSMLETDHDNFRAALEWGLAHPAQGPGQRLAAALVPLWFRHGSAHEGIRYIERALETVGDETPALRADLLCGLAALGIPTGNVTMAYESAQRALELGATIDDHRTLARAYAVAAYAPFYVDFPRCEHLARLAETHGDEAGETFAANLGLLLHACSLTNRDRHAEAEPLARQLFERCWPLHDRFFSGFALAVQAWGHVLTGDVRRAERLGAEALRIAEPLHDYVTVGTITTNLAWFKGMAGDLEAALKQMESVIRTVETADQDVDVVSLTTVPAKLHLWRGDLATALDWFDLSVRHEAASPDNWIAVRALPGLATTLRRLGRRDEAEEQAERGVAMAKRLDVPHALAEGLDELGRLAAADDSVAADDLHHDAVRVRLDHGLETQLVDSLDALAERAAMVESHAEAARLLGASNAARGRVGYPRPPVDWPQHEQLVALLREALGEEAFASATSEGSALSTGDAVAYAARARGARGRPRTGWASLTPTEQRVVELASEGLNNPEIGRRLFMSRDTVKTHLSHVYAKLGVANRAELAALVARAAPFARGEEGGGRDSWDR